VWLARGWLEFYFHQILHSAGVLTVSKYVWSPLTRALMVGPRSHVQAYVYHSMLTSSYIHTNINLHCESPPAISRFRSSPSRTIRNSFRPCNRRSWLPVIAALLLACVRVFGLDGCVDMWVTLGVCVCGCVGVWVRGCMGVWECGSVGVWVCGCVGDWSRWLVGITTNYAVNAFIRSDVCLV